MNRSRPLPVALALLLLAIRPVSQQPVDLRKPEDRERITRAVLDEPGAHDWMRLPWLPDLSSAVREAQQRDRPVLLWIMNGHPAGFC